MAQGMYIDATFGNAPLMEGLKKCLADRRAYLGESAADSCAAVAINVLKSLRTITKVAKKSHKVDIRQDGTLMLSCYYSGGVKIPCLRRVGNQQTHLPNRFISADKTGHMSQSKVFLWIDHKKEPPVQRYVVASSMSVAKKAVQKIIEKRVKRYRSLAKYTLGQLMHRTSTKQKLDATTNGLLSPVAEDNTSVKRFNNGKQYGIVLADTLNYATDALKGGKAQVDIQLKKAMNKMVSVINQGIKRKIGKEFFSQHRLPIMFPSVRSRRGK